MRRAALVVLALLVLAGCSSEPAAQPSEAIVTGQPPAATSSAAVPTEFGDGGRSDRGNLIKAIGQPGAVTADGQQIILEFRIDAIRQGAECQAQGYTERPENGQFLAVDVYARVLPEFEPSVNDTEFLGAAYSWTVVTADGRRVTVDTGAAAACAPASQRDLRGLTPGITVSGTVLLDAPTDLTGAVLVLTNATVDGGWEWEIPAV